MAEELASLVRGATSLALMMKGFDHELDIQLSALHDVLRDKEFHLAEFKSALENVEHVYDNLELITEKGIDSYTRTFSILLDETHKDILLPLQKESRVLADLLRLAEPISQHFSTLSPSEATSNERDVLSDELREKFINRFKSLLTTLMLMGDTGGSLGRLEALLAEQPSWKTLDKLVSKTIELLKKRLTDEKRQFEGYLSKLTQKLSRINEIVNADSETLSELKKINLDFNASINSQMIEARAKIDEHHGINSLKSGLLNSLDVIAKRLEEYQHSYTAKLHALQTSKLKMNEHINALEKENIHLLMDLERERKMSLIDPLTQLPNRQGFTNRLNEELSRVKRYQVPLSVAILDIDHFKNINDQFGHLVGDKVLRMISKEMKNTCRETDFIARFGGEEFILLLPQTQLSDAELAVDKLRQHIANCPFHYQNKPVPLTLSGGVAQLLENEETDSWLARADSALYKSKNTGRNKVTAA